ncbi:VOC family protein [Sphingomonas sp. AOB5]|uniref:VOC family protein n=1 Tax=Sphingomonas sp. AOB5 TaxID=3034017 RepID=UPI0023F7ADC5|nr:VOC family protein [Sphingomonas sp. AOB5]MDF7776080.1 VOC family protein [Sphingomonas sp. AOB5]
MRSEMNFWYHHGGVSVADLDASIAWYRDVLGFELDKRFHVPTIPADIAMMRNGDLYFELFEVPGSKALPHDRRVPDDDLQTQGNKHVAFVVQDAAAFAAEIESRGADIVWVKKMPHGSNAFIRDNSGNLIEFVEEPVPSGLPGSL